MSHPFIPIKTADLAWRENLLNSAVNRIDQCINVFIDGNNLTRRWMELPQDLPSQFNVAEIGFGSGLNFLTAWHLWEQHAPQLAQLHFVSCEKHPLSPNDLLLSLKNWPELAHQAQDLIESYPILTPGFHHLSFANGRVRLTLMLGDAYECYEQLLMCKEVKLEAKLRLSFIDAWFLDGFAAAHNKETWTNPLFQVIAMLSKEQTTLACDMTTESIKSSLIQAGFHLEDSAMIRAKFNHSTQGTKQKHTPWHVASASHYQTKKAVIVGAGLAGCFTAHSLAKRGWNVTLIEEQAQVGMGASANQRAVLFPKFSAHSSPLSQLMLQSYLYAIQVYKTILNQHAIGELKGCLLLAHNDKETRAQQQLAYWLSDYPQLAVLVDELKASELTGLPINKTGLFIPSSGWINSPVLCELLIDNERIELIANTSVNSLERCDNSWIINGIETPVLILANGHKLREFEETKELSVKSVRGQMTAIKPTPQSMGLKIPLCGEGHVLPLVNGSHYLGATFRLEEQLDIDSEDDALNLAKLGQLAHESVWSDEVVSSWAGIRATTPDYLPLVGQIPDEHAFKQVFAALKTDSNRWIPSAGSYYPGLYACAGFGSRGLTTIPLCAEWLAASINNELSFLPRDLIQALSPARFLRRSIIRGNP